MSDLQSETIQQTIKKKTDMVSRMEPDSDMTQMLELADKSLKTATNPWPVK